MALPDIIIQQSLMRESGRNSSTRSSPRLQERDMDRISITRRRVPTPPRATRASSVLIALNPSGADADLPSASKQMLSGPSGQMELNPSGEESSERPFRWTFIVILLFFGLGLLYLASLWTSQRNTHSTRLDHVVDMLISDPRFMSLLKESHLSAVSKQKKAISRYLNQAQATANTISVSVMDLERNMNAKFVDLNTKLDQASVQEDKGVLKKRLHELENELQEIRSKMQTDVLISSQDLTAQIERLQKELSSLDSQHATLDQVISQCNAHETLEKEVHSQLLHFLNVTEADDMDRVLDSRFVKGEHLQQRLLALSNELKSILIDQTVARLDQVAFDLSDSLQKQLMSLSHEQLSSPQSISKSDVAKIVEAALITYDADKTGLFDFALESVGGTIASTRCTETYYFSHAVYSVMGLPIWWGANTSPRTILQPQTYPGQCWAFKGSQGSIVIKLSNTIYVGHVTMEHIPMSLAPDGAISSAPQDFEVYGLNSLDEDGKEQLLGHFQYNISAQPVQTFALPQASSQPFKLVELKILSNHGNLLYTCIYRFRIHGRIAS